MVQLLRRLEPVPRVSDHLTGADSPERDDAVHAAAVLAPLIPDSLAPVFDASFIRSSRRYDEFVLRLALRVFEASGLALALDEPATAVEAATRAGLERQRARAPVGWILRRLAARGLLAQTGQGEAARFRAHGPLPALDPAPLRDAQRAEDASWLPSYVLAETVAQDYPAFLRGERAGEDVLFSPARLRLWVEFFSNDNKLYAVNNAVGAVAAAQWLPPGPAHVLELGGGLGSAAVALLDRLQHAGRWKDLVEYRFTEFVPAFLRRGQAAIERRFAEAPFVRTAPLDMNRPLAEQGVAPGSVSLVYAVNTLHVARDLDFTLGEIRHALAPGGALVVSECVRLVPEQTIYAEFVFNLLESFRSPVLHPVRRPNGGFLAPEHWRAAMEAAGLDDVRLVPDVDTLRDRFPQFNVAAIGATRPG
jgi:SAM-dependent methyltransferase